MNTINLVELARIRDGSGHSVFGPSGSGLFLNCTGGLIPNLLAPDVAGEDAAYGTVAHGVTELWGLTGKRPEHLVGTNEFIEAGEWGYLIEIDDVMLNYCEMCIDWLDLLPGVRFFERKVDFSRLTPIPRQTGTADFICIHYGRLIICDFKFGKHHMILADMNSQGMLYALGAVFEFHKMFGGEYDFDTIEIRIAQPRLDHFDTWEICLKDLLAWGEWAKERMAEAWTLTAPRTAGPKQCEFCRVKASCAANAKLNVEMTEGIFENLDGPVAVEDMQAFRDRVDDLDFGVEPVDVGTLNTSQIASMLPFRSMAERWWKSLEGELARRANAGEDITKYGWKFVEGRVHRVFLSEEEAVIRITSLGVPRNKLVTEKVATPAQAEKLLRVAGHKNKDLPNLLNGLVHKPPGKPTLAPLGDKRPALVDLSEASFDDLDSVNEDEEM